MDKRILAIFDSEENYAYRLMEFISEKVNLPFEIYVLPRKINFTPVPGLRISNVFSSQKASINRKWRP